jgi:hypothetical protein
MCYHPILILIRIQGPYLAFMLIRMLILISLNYHIKVQFLRLKFTFFFDKSSFKLLGPDTLLSLFLDTDSGYQIKMDPQRSIFDTLPKVCAISPFSNARIIPRTFKKHAKYLGS